MDIEKFLKFGETESTEFKESFNKKTVETAAAFSNTRGGTIFIGVNDDGGLKGISIGKETLKDWSNKISQNTEPSVIPEIRIENVNEKSIVIIKIQEYPLKPVATRGRCFRRVANSNRQMSPQEIAQMYLMSTGNSWDALPARDVAFDDIDLENVKNYIKASFATGRRKFRSTEDPLDALREALINAVCHRDYSDTSDIQIKIFDGHIQAWNPGPLPFGITIEELYHPSHSSKPRNKLIAQVFYDLGLIERYGSGIQRMINACVEAGLPEPVFEEKFGGFMVTFRKDIFTEEYLRKLDLNERQIKGIIYIKEKGKITNKEYQKLTGIKDRLATIELNDIVDKKVLKKFGTTGRGTYYALEKAQKAQ